MRTGTAEVAMWNWFSRLSLLVLIACQGAEVCETLSVEDCEGVPACQLVMASPLEFATGATCYDLGDPEAVGCEPKGQACPPSTKLAFRDGDSSCYEFGNCVPDGFGACPDSETLEQCF